MRTRIAATLAALAVGASALTAAGIGHAAAPPAKAHPVYHRGSNAVHSTMRPDTSDRWKVTRREAYLRYLDAYSGNGCRADFVENYHGTRFIRDLEKPARDEIAWQRQHNPDVPAFIDYGEGSAIEVRSDQVILIGQYAGACER